MKLHKILCLFVLFTATSCSKNSNQLQEIGRIIDTRTRGGEVQLDKVITINSSARNIEYLTTELGKEATITLKDVYYEDFEDQKPRFKPNFSSSSTFTTTDRQIKFVEKIWNDCFKENKKAEIIISCAYRNDGLIYSNPASNESIALFDYDKYIDLDHITGKSVRKSYNQVIKFINDNSNLKLKRF